MEDELKTSLSAKIRHFVGGKKRDWESNLKRQAHFNAKNYYRTYVANDIVSPLNEQLVRDVLSYNPKSVFEFGCGVGKNLALLRDRVDYHLGIDISEKAIEIATKKNLNVRVNDETSLKDIENCDIIFTCSVLDHIKYIDDIVKEFKRIAKMAIVVAETNTKLTTFYYPHDYESLGFVRTNYAYLSRLSRKEAVYHIWHHEVV